VRRRLAGTLAVLSTIALSGCMSGRVLSGYPGYPFARFEAPVPADSAFFRLQHALEVEGFPLDYTFREDGYITTRSATVAGRPVFLNLVVESAEESAAGEAGTGSVVWLAAYGETEAGSERINPLHDGAWQEVMAIAGRLSAAVGGEPPVGPPLNGR
jgi:hypothetical protein